MSCISTDSLVLKQLPNYFLVACSDAHTEKGYFVNKGKGKGIRGFVYRLVVTHFCAQVRHAFSGNLSFTCTPLVAFIR